MTKKKTAPKKQPAKKDSERKLTLNQKLFCDEYVIDRNGTRAYKAAYKNVKKDHTAAELASRMLRNDKVKALIDKKLKKTSTKLEITAERVVLEMARLAFFDPRKLFDESWNLLPLSEIDDDTAACIGGVDIAALKSVKNEDDYQETIKKLKIWDKNASLDKLSKHFGIFEKDNQQKNELAESTKAFLEKVTGKDEKVWQR